MKITKCINDCCIGLRVTWVGGSFSIAQLLWQNRVILVSFTEEDALALSYNMTVYLSSSLNVGDSTEIYWKGVEAMATNAWVTSS